MITFIVKCKVHPPEVDHKIVNIQKWESWSDVQFFIYFFLKKGLYYFDLSDNIYNKGYIQTT